MGGTPGVLLMTDEKWGVVRRCRRTDRWEMGVGVVEGARFGLWLSVPIHFTPLLLDFRTCSLGRQADYFCGKTVCHNK